MTAQPGAPLFGSMLMAGFECAAQRRRDGRRLDLTVATGHDRRAAADYGLIRAHGMVGARDGLNWPRIEARAGRFDWSGVVPMLQAAQAAGITPVWDLLHFGLPDDVDPFTPAFIGRFARFAGAAARLIAAETDGAPAITPINEISFWAFGGGEVGGLNPFVRGQGAALKRQLVRAALAAIAEVRAVNPLSRICTAEPLIHVHPAGPDAAATARAEAHNQAQHEAVDMLLGQAAPELGGHGAAIDVVGHNHYADNQWIDGGRTVALGDWRHRPLRLLLQDAAARHGKPCYVAETGCEGGFRPGWLNHVADEVRAARALGVPVGGLCLYPILSHLGWEDDRRCANGLFDAHDRDAPRIAFAPLAREVAAQAAAFARLG